jgi:hypothetical protein
MPSTTKLKISIGRALRRSIEPADQAVHFHLSSDGRPFVCDLHACDSAALTIGEVQSLRQAA